VNTGSLFLPDGLVAPYRQPEASTWDDGETPHGPRYAAMQAWKANSFRPAAARAAAAFEEIRRVLARHENEKPRRTPAEAVCRVPGAHPENVLLTREEIDALLECSHPVVAGETLWAQAEEAAEYRIEAQNRRSSWEYQPPAPPEPY
jgi:hypothetical protein